MHPSTLPDSATVAFARSDDEAFGVLQSRIHELWALRLGTSLEDRPRYTPTTCFETFPFPEGLTPNLKPEEYTNRYAGEIAAAAKRLNGLRENWLNPPEWVDVVPEVVKGYPDRIIPRPEFAKAIKERTLTNLYNARQKGEVQWLDDAHRALDAAVAKTYGWDDYTPEMPDDEILRRLLKLNLERAAKAH
jgi:type II restriction/modification system DNA methylase subunit YeeA